MPLHRGFQAWSRRRLLGFVAFIAVAAAVGGCAGTGLTGDGLLSGGVANTTRDATAPARRTAGRGVPQRADTAAKTPASAMAKARQLRIEGKKLAALDVLRKAGRRNPGNLDLMTQQGLVALEAGHIAEARKLLSAAVDGGRKDWRIYSGLGAAYAANGQHKKAAIALERALRLSPDNAAVLNNLALAHAMAGNLKKAERLLRRVVARRAQGRQLIRANQNLALVLGLRGKLGEAQRVASSTLPRSEAEANVAYLRRMASNVKVSKAPAKSDNGSGRFAGLSGK